MKAVDEKIPVFFIEQITVDFIKRMIVELAFYIIEISKAILFCTVFSGQHKIGRKFFHGFCVFSQFFGMTSGIADTCCKSVLCIFSIQNAKAVLRMVYRKLGRSQAKNQIRLRGSVNKTGRHSIQLICCSNKERTSFF